MTRAVLLVAALACACVPASAPGADAGDGGTSCEVACADRIRVGCIEPAFIPRCVPVCERARAAGIYEPCTSCRGYTGSDGAPHVRCLSP